jgi:dTMP kinase
MFIVLEGIDGSGKTTLSENLIQTLNTTETKSIRFSEPTSLESGIYIRKFLKGEMVLTPAEQMEAFLLDREASVKVNILPALDSKKIVVLDRYYFSTAAYQASENFSPEDILDLNLQKKFPKPDLLFFIDLKPEDAIKRIQQRGTTKEVFESIEELTRIYSNFKKVLPSSTIYLDGTLSQNELVRQCIHFINSFTSID